MSAYPNFETSTLVELLVLHTQRLTELFAKNKFDREYERCKKMIEQLQAEINFRNRDSNSRDAAAFPG